MPPSAKPPRKIEADPAAAAQLVGVNGPGTPAGTVRKRTISSDPTREYVAGGSYYWTASFIKSLPFYIDELSRDFGDDIYERMLLDPQVESDTETVKLSVLAQGVALTPAVKKDEKNYNKAIEIRDFCQRALDAMKSPITTVCHNLLDAMAFGNKVAEVVYHVPGDGPLSGFLVPDYIKPKPRRAVAFVVDVANNVVGLLGLIPGQAFPLLVDGVWAGSAPNLLPRRKFLVLTNDPKDGDPRGTSILRAAYNPWWMKQQSYPLELKYLAQWASPSIWATTAENAPQTQKVDDYGNPVYDEETGVPVQLNPEEVLMSRLLDFQSGSVIAMPFGTQLQPLTVPDRGEVFNMFRQARNEEISKAITGQVLANNESQHQTRAASDVHQDVMGLRVQHGKEMLQNALRADLLMNLVEWNYGRKYLPLCPFVSLSETNDHDFVAESGAVATLWEKGYLTVSQVPDTDARLGLPKRSEADMTALQERAAAAHEQAVNPPDPQGDGQSEEEDETDADAS